MYTHTHTYIHTYMHTYTHTYIHTHIHTHTYIHTYIHTYVRTYIHTYIHSITVDTEGINQQRAIASFDGGEGTQVSPGPDIYIYILYTSSTAQGGGGSFKNRKTIGELGCCESGMAERSH